MRSVGQPRSTLRYGAEQESPEQQRLVARIHELVRKHPRYGYRFITAKLRQEGWKVNFKRIYRLWRREGFKVPKKCHKKRRLGHHGNSCVRRLRAQGSRLDMGFHSRPDGHRTAVKMVCDHR